MGVDLNPGPGEQLWKGEYQVTSPPAVVGDRVVVGSAVSDNARIDAPSGVVRAFDARTGRLAWAWDLAPPGFDRAAGLWEEAGKAGEPEGWRELAMHHEHRTRDLDAALGAVERGMRLVSGSRGGRSWQIKEGFRHRRERLRRKQARRRA